MTPTTKCSILGLILDQKLNWNDHIEHIEAKTIKSLGALSSLGGSTWGTGYKGLRQIYQAIILPQITYAASVWYAPLNFEGTYRDKTVRKLEAIQKKAAKIITGAFKTVAGTALDVEAFLLPIQLKLKRTATETYLRIIIITTPSYRTVEQAGKDGIWTGYTCDWHNLLSKWGPGTTKNLEQRDPFPTLPWWEPPVAHMAKDMMTARTTYDQILQQNRGLIIYTDGSAIMGKWEHPQFSRAVSGQEPRSWEERPRRTYSWQNWSEFIWPSKSRNNRRNEW